MELTCEEQKIYDQLKVTLWFMNLTMLGRETDIKEKYPNVWNKLLDESKRGKNVNALEDIEDELQSLRCQMYADTTRVCRVK